MQYAQNGVRYMTTSAGFVTASLQPSYDGTVGPSAMAIGSCVQGCAESSDHPCAGDGIAHGCSSSNRRSRRT